MQGEDKKKTEELLQTLVIIELARVGVPQLEIQKIIGIDIHRVNKIAKHFKKLNHK